MFFLKFFFLVLTIFVVAALALALRPSWFFGVNGHQLAYSVNQAIRAPMMDCSRVSERSVRWTCTAEQDPNSGYLSLYSVRLNDSGCWTARRTNGSDFKRRATGCVESSDPWWDLWSWIA